MKFKKLLAAFCLLACGCMAPGQAQAAETGVYVAPKFLMSAMNAYVNADTGNTSSDRFYSQFTLGGGLAAGYDFYVKHQIPLRAEVEGMFRGNQKNSWNTGSHDIKGTWNTTTVMANFYYDFHNDSPITPYLGAGIGVASNYAGYSIRHAGVKQGSVEDYSAALAWNVGCGASYAFNDNVAADLGYRFMSTGQTSQEGTKNGTRYSFDTNVNGHEFTLGLRWTF